MLDFLRHLITANEEIAQCSTAQPDYILRNVSRNQQLNDEDMVSEVARTSNIGYHQAADLFREDIRSLE